MTKLPAIYFAAAIEADALAYAKKLVAWYRDKQWFSSDSVLSQEAAHAFAIEYLKQRARGHHDAMMHIAKQARAGSEDARKALLDLANEYLHENAEMPPSLASFQMECNKGLIPKRRGRDLVSNSMRNIAIAMMVSELCAKFGLQPTGRSARRHSGCHFIAVALASELPRGTIKPGDDAVVTIWKEWKWALAPFSPARIIL
jgi:hypothetical protein